MSFVGGFLGGFLGSSVGGKKGKVPYRYGTIYTPDEETFLNNVGKVMKNLGITKKEVSLDEFENIIFPNYAYGLEYEQFGNTYYMRIEVCDRDGEEHTRAMLFFKEYMRLFPLKKSRK